jgi:Uma2 family endonuclease
LRWCLNSYLPRLRLGFCHRVHQGDAAVGVRNSDLFRHCPPQSGVSKSKQITLESLWPTSKVHLPAPGTATEQDAIDVEARENRLCELVDGVLVEKTVGFYESFLAVRLAGRLENFVEANHLGVVTGEGGMVQIFPGLVRIPDVAFASWKEFPDGLTDEPVPKVVPDLAVEVLNEGNTEQEMDGKLDDYFGAGVRLVWFVEPRKKTVEVFTARDSSIVLDENATLSGGDVLPGFSLPLKSFFAKPKKV